MKTTLNFDDRLIREAKKRAIEDGDTLTRLIERTLRDSLASSPDPATPSSVELITMSSRLAPGVDLADRNMLYERMEGRQ